MLVRPSARMPSRATAAQQALVVLCGLSLAACGKTPSLAPPRPASLPYTVTTQHFVIHTDLDAEARDFHARLFEAFRAAYTARFHELPETATLPIYLFQGNEAFAAFGRELGASANTSGFFAVLTNGAPILVVDLSTGLGTAMHELVHAFVHFGFPRQPPLWFHEGLAAYHEKFLGSLDDTRLDISFGYFSNWRFPLVKAQVDTLTLAGLDDPARDPTSAARDLMLFLDRRGLFVPLVRAMRTAIDDESGMRTLAQVAGDLETLEREWKDWIRAQPLDEEVFLVPKATVLPASQWSEWLASRGKRLAWRADLQRYVPAPAEPANGQPR